MPNKRLYIWISLLIVCCSARLLMAESIAVGCKKFPESRLLAEMMALLIESNTELEVERKYGLGGTAICFAALEYGEIDLYPEYTGTGLQVILDENHVTGSGDELYKYVKQQFADRYNITWLPPLGFNNTYAIAISSEFPITKISELQSYEDDINFAFTHEFLNRRDGYPGLSKHYGLDLRRVTGMEHGLVYKAIEEGIVDATDAYVTDGKLLKYDLNLLEDDRHFFPPYDAAPLIRRETLRAHPKVGQVLQSLAGIIDDSTMRALNYQVEVEGRTFRNVAIDFLTDQGLIDKKAIRRPAFKNPLVAQTIQHLLLTAVATGFAILMGIPLGLYITRKKRIAGTVLSLTGIIQTIPSLALLGFMIPLFGIGVTPAIVALFLYALLPIVRNTYTGIQNVDQNLKEAGTAMGMTDFQLLTKLELPLALTTIMAGIRIATVINIGTATLAAFIGAGGLGEFIITGISLNDNNLILKGAVPAALLAVVIDFLLLQLEHQLAPRGLKKK